MHFVDLATVKANLVKTDTVNDLFIETLLGFIDARIVNLCNQQLFLTQRQLTFKGNGSTTKVLPNFPVLNETNLSTGLPYLAALETVTNYPSTAGGTVTWTAVTGFWQFQNQTVGGWQVFYQPGFVANTVWGTGLWVGYGSPPGYRNYRVTYGYGFPVQNQLLYVTGSGTGTFQLQWNGQTTAAIAFNATVATVQTAVNAFTGKAGTLTISGATLGSGTQVATFSDAADAMPLTVVNPTLAPNTIIAATAATGVLSDVQQVAMEMADILFKQSEILGLEGGGRLGIDSITNSTALGISMTTRFTKETGKWKNMLQPYTLIPSP